MEEITYTEEERRVYDSFILGLKEASQEAGVSVTTLVRWLNQGKFDDEKTRKVGGTWFIDKEDLARVRQESLAKGKGALKAGWLKYPHTPRGYLPFAIRDVPEAMLVEALYQCSESYEKVGEALGTGSRKAQRILRKSREIYNELKRRGFSPQLPDNLKNYLVQRSKAEN